MTFPPRCMIGIRLCAAVVVAVLAACAACYATGDQTGMAQMGMTAKQDGAAGKKVETAGKGTDATGRQAEMAAQMDGLLSSLYRADRPGAAVLVAKDGKIIFRKGYGLANVEHSVPITPDTVFRIASMTKQFTAVAILMLMERGRLELDDPIAKYLPDYPNGDRITIRHLLTHTSGVWDYVQLDEVLQGLRRDVTVDELLAFFKDKPLDFEPGERMAYSNSGYTLLGAIIEKVSGRPYADFLQDSIFKPAGMTSTTVDSHDKIILHRAAGYETRNGELHNVPFMSMTESFANGNIAASVNDLFRWNEALFNGLIKPKTLEQATSPTKLNDGTYADSGFGFGISQIKGRKAVIHPGGIRGFLAYGLMAPSERLYVVWLSNHPAPQPRTPSDLVAELAAIAMGEPFSRGAPVELPEDLLKAYAGAYVGPPGSGAAYIEECSLERRGPALWLHVYDTPYETVPTSSTEFHLKKRPIVTFKIRTEGGGPARLDLDWPLGVCQTFVKKD